jgi:hypothetical protein
MPRVYITTAELETEVGKQLLEMSIRIATDGKLDLPEIKELRSWLLSNQGNESVAAVSYLQDIMARITADRVIERDELLELHLAVERVIPTSHRHSVLQARKQQEAARRERMRERRRLQKEKEDEERKRLRAEEIARALRVRHSFGKVSGVTFPNDDGSERQAILGRCKRGEQLSLRHDADNQYSTFAIQVLRANGEQLGHAPEYLAERIYGELEDGYNVVGLLTDLTGGTWDKPTRGANFVVFFVAKDVPEHELHQYAAGALAGQM